MRDGTTVKDDARRVEGLRRETEGALPAARRKLEEAGDARNAHTVSLSAEIEYAARATEVGMLELERRIRDEADREYAEQVRRDAVRNLTRVRDRVAREAAR